jgi:hypothetical protein
MPFELLQEEAPQSASESFPSKLLRGTVRTASRVGEQIAGAPGDIFSLINDYIARPVTEKITGKPGLEYEKTLLGKILPPTTKHREATKKGFEGYTEPKNDVEKFFDDVFQDATAIAIPGVKGSKIASKALKSLGISSIANTVGAGIQDITADESKASIGKLGSLFMLSLLDKPKAAQTVAEMYKPLSDKVTQLAPVNASRLENTLQNLQSKVSKGTMAPSEKFIFDEAGEILSKIKQGNITPEELWAVKRSLNEKMIKTLFDTPDKLAQARAKKLTKHILKEVDGTLAQTAKQDPNFYKDLKKADRAFGVIADSNWIAKYIEKNSKYNPVTHGLIEMFRGSIGSNAAAAVLPYQSAKILYRISKSPILAKHYSKILSSAAKDDAIIMNNELKKLDKALEKEEKKSKFELID